uniref:Uncharacterized protein n=1 Tax=Poecilia mexicana TaxID=48701 RepID=A0A3B3YXP3_9TELE
MPRGKSHRRSEAAKRRVEAVGIGRVGIPNASSDFVSRRGTGWRHSVKPWPASVVTNHCHKLVIPRAHPDKKFILLIGASHLRSFVDGIVEMPSGCLQFGFMSTPGACAADLHLEAMKANVPLEPDAVFCTGFVPRLTESREKQNLFQQEFHRRSAKLGIPFFPTTDHFPIHLSDDHGMHILRNLIWNAGYQFLELSAPKPLVQSLATPPYQPRFVLRVIVKGVESLRRSPPSPHPSEWTLVRSGRKRNHSGELDSVSDSPKKRVVHYKSDGTPVALRECFIPLNPVRFSPAILVAMETVSPLALPHVHTGTEIKPVEHKKKPALPKRSRVTREVKLTLQSARTREASDCPGVGCVCPLEVPAGQGVCIMCSSVSINK